MLCLYVREDLFLQLPCLRTFLSVAMNHYGFKPALVAVTGPRWANLV